MKNSWFAGAAIALMVSACAGPIETRSTRAVTPSSVELVNAPEGAILRVGNEQAIVRQGVANLAVADGWHDVTVLTNGGARLSRRVFVQDGSVKVIDFAAPN